MNPLKTERGLSRSFHRPTCLTRMVVTRRWPIGSDSDGLPDPPGSNRRLILPVRYWFTPLPALMTWTAIFRFELHPHQTVCKQHANSMQPASRCCSHAVWRPFDRHGVLLGCAFTARRSLRRWRRGQRSLRKGCRTTLCRFILPCRHLELW